MSDPVVDSLNNLLNDALRREHLLARNLAELHARYQELYRDAERAADELRLRPLIVRGPPDPPAFPGPALAKDVDEPPFVLSERLVAGVVVTAVVVGLLVAIGFLARLGGVGM
jgi:hypothetical protein